MFLFLLLLNNFAGVVDKIVDVPGVVTTVDEVVSFPAAASPARSSVKKSSFSPSGSESKSCSSDTLDPVIGVVVEGGSPPGAGVPMEKDAATVAMVGLLALIRSWLASAMSV